MFSSFDGENTKAVDPYTVDICVKQPFAAIYNYLASSRGDIICKSAMEEMGGEAYGRQPVGTGALCAERVEYRRQPGADPQRELLGRRACL